METFKFASLSRQVCALALAALFIDSASAGNMTEAWVRCPSGAGSEVAVGTNGTLFVAGSATTMAYSQAGVPLWTNSYNVPGDSFGAMAIVVGSNGTVFVSGNAKMGGTFDDYATFAYSQEGVPLWTNRYNGPGNDYDRVSALAVGTNGTLFVTGYSQAVWNDNADYATIAYSQDGVPLWTNRYNGGNGSWNDDFAAAVAVGPNGTVFVTGSSCGDDTWNDWATIAYSQEGVPLWTNRYDGRGNDMFGDIGDQATAMVVGTDGTVFVTGFSVPLNSTYNPDYTTIAYSQDGVPLWTNHYSFVAPSGDDRPTAIAVDSDGTVFVTGASDGSGTYADYATIAYSHAGVPLWTNRYNGPGNNYDGARAVSVDTNGTVFVTGTSYGNGSSGDIATIAYSHEGVPLSTNRYNGPWNYYDGASSLAIVPGGVLVAGSSGDGSRFGYYYTLVKYSTITLPPGYNMVSGLQLDDGAMRLSYVGLPSTSYALDRTLNLAPPDWIPQITNVADAGGLIIFTNAPDPTANNFWRVHSVP